MIDRAAAMQLLNFGARIGAGPRAEEQLSATVAIHNTLHLHKVAYLADEVGMGKTYVALGVVALFRHFNPGFRFLVIAPRENIQLKWMKEFRNFIQHNIRFADQRVKSLDGRSVRSMVSCSNLRDYVRELVTDRSRDFFLRLSSFSLPVAGKDSVDSSAGQDIRNELRQHLPWMRDEVFDLRNKSEFKLNIARAVSCALPEYDLVIVDEAHNLKHGFSANVAARNRVLATVFGRKDSDVDTKLFPHYRSKAKRVLFLSATPIEESYSQLWNQLDIFGLAHPFHGLIDDEISPDEKKKIASNFLIRRVTTIHVGEKEYTKNLYRREWRRGGVNTHDEPIRITDPRKRLVVALVQKKVSELLGNERFNTSFQIGMLASFESFLETARVKVSDDEASNFDDAEQTESEIEKEGIDVSNINHLARSYREKFGLEMPHPKMDSLVEELSKAWRSGVKALVFVRRVASVKELKRKLDEKYDEWLINKLRLELPDKIRARFERIVKRYRREQEHALARNRSVESYRASSAKEDSGGLDTFFAWFFRGDGPTGVVSGANIQQRFTQSGSTFSTFFEDNYVADVLDCAPLDTLTRIESITGLGPDELKSKLAHVATRFLSRAKKHGRGDRLWAAQGAAIELLKDVSGAQQERAKAMWNEKFVYSIQRDHATEALDVSEWLKVRTFFTELRSRRELRNRLWPLTADGDPTKELRVRELRSQLLATAARLGHAFIDLYTMTMYRLKSFELNVQEGSEEGKDIELERIHEYLDLLEKQMRTPLQSRDWGAFDELAEIASNFNLILDVNTSEILSLPLPEYAKSIGQLLRQQQPTGGMSGQVNQTLVRQFRMPGYPFVMVTTDLLQEGEDLHTFCSNVFHFGISWTPSSMEQRIGRIDRVRSQTDRRLSSHTGALNGEHLLQVYFPHLEDTVEVLQVHRVLERMNTFLRLMHEGLTTAAFDEKKIDTSKEFARGLKPVPQIREVLRSAFPVKETLLRGETVQLQVNADVHQQLRQRFLRLKSAPFGNIRIEWEDHSPEGVLLGTVILDRRKQPFSLILQSYYSKPLIRCISPVGCIEPKSRQEQIREGGLRKRVRVGAIEATSQARTYDLTVEDDVLLAEEESSDCKRIQMLLENVVHYADELELEYLDRDESINTFRGDLERESTHGR